MATTLLPHPTIDRTPSVIAPPRRRRVGALAIEVAVMGAVFVAYRQVRHLTSGDTGDAFANAERVVALEQRLGIFHEGAVQRLVLHSDAVVAFLNRYYVGVHFPATIALLLWACWRHPHAYRRIRAAFLGVTLAALVVHVLVPLAPPRMLAGEGFVDTLRVYGPRIYPTDTTQSVANQFAAMPSLHFGWAALVAGAIVLILRTRWRWLAVLHPTITLLAIVATANHFWLDAIVAGVLVAAAAACIRHWSRRQTGRIAPAPAGAVRAIRSADVASQAQPDPVAA
jgi:hypothetical protein